MELKLLFYIVLGLVYLFFSISKSKKKQAEVRRQQQPKPAQRSWDEQLKEIIERSIEPQYEPPPPPPEKPETVFLNEEIDSYEAQLAEERKAHQKQESYSVEYDTAPLSSHMNREMEAMSAHETPPSVAAEMLSKEPFDARKAFIYSEIFRRKY